MTRRPALWVLLCLGSIAGAWFAWRTFPSAFPLVNVDLRMDRAQALAVAESLAQAHGWGPVTPGHTRLAATFDLDENTQTFVELEGGGKEAFTRMLHDGLYEAYTWRVRRFQAGQANETQIRFTPAGRPYAFKETLEEKAPGNLLSPDSARALAEREATGNWGIDLHPYTLVEQSHEVRPGGRTDHTLVYERDQPRLGEGRYRLRLVVGGDRLIELNHFVKVPEAFSRRYEKMRSANRAIAFAGAVVIALVYLIGGCIGGMIYLLRRRWLLWRPAVICGAVIAFAQLLAGINAWPLVWMSYDTALSDGSFVLQQVAQLVGGFLAATGLFGLTFLAAEGLSRRAFPHHPQLWRLWSREAAASREVVGRTLAGYCLLGWDLAYLVAFYLLTTRVLGWWNPSESLAQPDVLAHYFPWYSSLALPLQAGFWEESLFRAVPLAGAALLGDHFGNRRAWIIGGLILEALVFGSGHATYAAQPAYARLVELIVPSLIYGLVYLRWGLLPVILVHFTYDAALFSLPLFVSSASGIWVDRALVVLLALTPLWVVLRARVQVGGWLALDAGLRNGAWWPPEATAEMPVPVVAAPRRAAITPLFARLAVVAGGAGLLVWALAQPFSPLTPPLRVGRTDALGHARQEMNRRGIRLPDRFRYFTSVDADAGLDDRFVWQTAGAATYRRLLGNYLDPPEFVVRAASFEGDVADRAEEWRAVVDGEGRVTRVQHQLPESRSGAQLEEAQARALGDSVLRASFGGGLEHFKEVSLSPSAHPARRDWLLTVADTTSPGLPQGERRVAVTIAGSEVTDAYRFIHVAEEWERQARNRASVTQMFDLARLLLLVAVCMTGAILGLIRWSRGQFPSRFGWSLAGILAAAGLVALLNQWPALSADFSTAEPYGLQVTITLIARGLAAVFFGLVVALLAGLAFARGHPVREPPSSTELRLNLMLGLALGAAAAGLLILADRVQYSSTPDWPGYGGAGAHFSWLSAAVSRIGGFALRTALILCLVLMVDRISAEWTRRRGAAAAILLAVGPLILPEGDLSQWYLWLLLGLVMGGYLLWLYMGFLRFDLSLAPILAAAISGLEWVRVVVQQNYPGAAAGGVLGIVFMGWLAWWWRGWLARGYQPFVAATAQG